MYNVNHRISRSICALNRYDRADSDDLSSVWSTLLKHKVEEIIVSIIFLVIESK